jgi:hypothetical protein
VFAAAQSLGLDVLPRHFYSEIPDLRALRQTESWRRSYSMQGVRGIELESQLAWVKSVLQPDLQAGTQNDDIHRLACSDNGEPGYGEIEAIALHCFVRKLKPQRIIQVGCGVSTAVCLRAASESGSRPNILCIEPYPTRFLERLASEGRVRLLRQQLQETDPAVAEELAEGDLFFVDSTHTLGPAGEATRIILEFLPRLRKDVLIHFHDIVFPYDYTPDILDGAMFFPHESALLHAFLAYNSDFVVLASMAMLHHGSAQELGQLLRNYRPARHENGIQTNPGHFPSSIFLKRIAVTS